MANDWSNWSGSLRFRPDKIVAPESEEEVIALIHQANEQKKNIRVVGAGHSSSPLVVTEDILISMQHFKGVEYVDLDKNEAIVLPGTTIHEAGKELAGLGLAMHNTGDVDVQQVAGAIGTGTHGTGKSLQNLSTMLGGIRFISGEGKIVELNESDEPELMRAVRVSLGTFGVFTKLKLKLLPVFNLHRREWFTTITKCLENLDELIERNRNFDFYWYPRNDMAKLRIMNEPGEGMNDIPYAKLNKEMEGLSYEILPRHRELKFDEMEYSLPAESGVECLREIRKRIKEKYRKTVGWRILYRTVKADDNMLSTTYKRDTVTISLHQNAGLPFLDYFRELEPVFRSFEGRPHWGKKHFLKAEELNRLYPEMDKFLSFRKQYDPTGIFVNEYLKHLLGIDI